MELLALVAAVAGFGILGGEILARWRLPWVIEEWYNGKWVIRDGRSRYYPLEFGVYVIAIVAKEAPECWRLRHTRTGEIISAALL